MTAAIPEAHWFESYFEKNQQQLLEDFFTFLRFKSISASPDHKAEMRDCATWLAQYIRGIGLEVEQWETSSHPVLLASWMKAGPDKPTVLIYNHYDVQPAGDDELWQSPAFEPTIRDGEIYARGAQDNKGQCFYLISAIRALLERDGSLPVNIKLCIEGEEETGSQGLAELLPSKLEDLATDFFVVVDMGIEAMTRPAVTLGIRGATFLTIKLRGSRTDLHSGIYGGIAYNPLHAIVEMLASARNADGSVAIPGFYDDVIEPDKEELSNISLDFDKQLYERVAGGLPNGGEQQYSPFERSGIRPTLEINGIGGGYFGEGVKTVIPAEVVAKVSCRLVPNQDPKKIIASVKDFFESKVPEGMEAEIEVHSGGGPAVRVPTAHPGVQAAAKAIAEVCETDCEFILCGGSVPVIAEMSKAVKCEPILMGFGLPGDNMHAPDEHFGIERLKKGLATFALLLQSL